MIIPPVMLVAMVDEHVTELMRQAAHYRRAARHRRASREPNSGVVADVPRSSTKNLDNGPSHRTGIPADDARLSTSGRPRQ